MPTRREQQREKRADAMRRAADKLFRSKGYTKTSIEDIAAEAEVSPATVYNYFGTKFDLLHALMRPEMDRVTRAAAVVLANLPDDVLAGVEALTRCYELGPDWLNRDLLMPFAEDFFLSNRTERNPIRTVSEARARDFTLLFQHYKAQGRLRSDMNVDDAGAIISSLFQYHLRLFLFRPDADERQQGVVGLSYLERRIRMAISGMVNDARDIHAKDQSGRSRGGSTRTRPRTRTRGHGGTA
jgi:AcrR family transcriptional regulator